LRLRRGAAGDAGMVDEGESDIGQIQDTLATRLGLAVYGRGMTACGALCKRVLDRP